jgi:hypothetical protein
MNDVVPISKPGELSETTSRASVRFASLAGMVSDPNCDPAKFAAFAAIVYQEEDREIARKEREAEYLWKIAHNKVVQEMPPVIRDAPNTQTKSRYAKYESIARLLKPIYTKHGFSLSFNDVASEDSDKITIECEVSHIGAPHCGGFTKKFRLPGRIDNRGINGAVNKTDLHGMASTITYLRRYLVTLIFDVTSENEDDDGNAGGGSIQRNKFNSPPPSPRPPPNTSPDDWLSVTADALWRQEPGYEWKVMLLKALRDAPSLADVEGIAALEVVERAMAEAPPKAFAEINAAFAAATAHFKKPANDSAPTVDKDPSQQTPKPQENRQQVQAPAFSFEAVLIDAAGEPVDPPFTDPFAFAHAFMALWRAAPSADVVAALLEYNEGGIDEARQHGNAAEVLIAIDEPRESAGPTQSPTVHEAVTPATERGKPNWSGWAKTSKERLSAIPPDQIEAWATAQKDVLAAAPLAQRVLVIRSLALAMGEGGITPPPWLADLQRKPATTQESRPEPEPPAATIAATADERWAERTIAGLDAETSAKAAAELGGSTAVQTIMRRLKRENEPLFARVDAAFRAALARLNP